MYSLYSYGAMVDSAVRTDAYIQALRQTVKPGSVVLDIGTGAGIWALYACLFGARKVYAVEPCDVIELARETAELNGLSGRIEFIQDLSTRITLPEQADVMVSDIRGVLPPNQTSLASIRDARRRLLRPDGVIIPLRDTLWVGLTRGAKVYEAYVRPWEQRPFDMRNLRQRATNLWKKELVPAEDLVAHPQCWAVLDYTAIDSDQVAGTVTWMIAKEGSAHGLTAWFDTALTEIVGFSNAPGLPEVIYGRAFFPWPEAIALQVGDAVSATLKADPVGSDYLWSWETRVLRDGREEWHFRQSEFLGEPLSAAHLRKRATCHRPALTEAGEMERRILSLIDGQRSVEDIAREIQDRFPEAFHGLEEARNKVGDVSQRWSR